MSPEAVVAERLYHDLKRQLMAGAFPPGAQIIVQQAAEYHRTSISPVRDALHRLVGERLVETHGKGGFTVPLLSVERVTHLYAWHADLVRVLIKAMTSSDPIGDFPGGAIGGPNEDWPMGASMTAELFARLGACSPNPEHLHAIVGLSDRLHSIRLHESRIGDVVGELAVLWNVTRSGHKESIRAAMRLYHRRRISNVRKLCEAAIGL